MPFRSMPDGGVLTPEDMDFLQQVYETAADSISNVDCTTMHSVVRMLIDFYQAGERDRIKLVAMATRDLQRAAG